MEQAVMTYAPYHISSSSGDILLADFMISERRFTGRRNGHDEEEEEEDIPAQLSMGLCFFAGRSLLWVGERSAARRPVSILTLRMRTDQDGDDAAAWMFPMEGSGPR